MNLAVFMDASLEEMSRNGQLPRLIYYLEAYTTRFDKVFVVTHDKNSLSDNLPERCVHLHTGNLVAGSLHPFVAPFLFRRELEESDVYRVLGLVLRSLIPSMIASLLYAKPVVATYQYRYSEFAEIEGRSPIVVLLTRLKDIIGLLIANKVIVTTEGIGEHVKKVFRRKETWLIPNGVVLSFFPMRKRKRMKKETDRRVLFVGRLTKQKNLFSLLEAVRGIDGTELTIVGEGPLHRRLLDYSEEAGLNVRFEGNVPHDKLKEYYHAADVFVLPSLIEGHPKVLLEAMACGLPVVGTDVEGTRSIITHERTGLLCGTDPDSIARAVKRLLEDPDLAVRLGENARVLVEQEYDLKMLLSRETSLLANLAESLLSTDSEVS